MGNEGIGNRPAKIDWFPHGEVTLTSPQNALYAHEHTKNHTPWHQDSSESDPQKTKRGCFPEIPSHSKKTPRNLMSIPPLLQLQL